MIKLKGGVVIMLFGLMGMLFGLANNKLTMMEKIPITIFCFALLVFGLLMETPIMDQLRETRHSNLQQDFQ